MIYKITFVSNDKYELSFQGHKKIVSLSFLQTHLKPHKLEELEIRRFTSVRDNWTFKDEVNTDEAEIDNSHFELVGKATFPGGYVAEKSKYSGLYELWNYSVETGWRFVSYIFHLESVDTFITEDRSWLKFKKKLKKSMPEVELGIPDKK